MSDGDKTAGRRVKGWGGLIQVGVGNRRACIDKAATGAIVVEDDDGNGGRDCDEDDDDDDDGEDDDDDDGDDHDDNEDDDACDIGRVDDMSQFCFFSCCCCISLNVVASVQWCEGNKRL